MTEPNGTTAIYVHVLLSKNLYINGCINLLLYFII